jgi:toxin ParE1/3/4
VARVLKREAAKRDLIAQWVWYAENAGIEVADRFLAAVDSTAATLARQPEIGIPLPLKKAALQGVRRFPISDGFEKILLFYFPLQDGIDLVRVVHSARDFGRLISEGFFG